MLGATKMRAPLKTLILSTSCLLLLSPALSHAGWDQKALSEKIKVPREPKTKLDFLERENEQLRNAIAQLRKGNYKQESRTHKSRIQALVEENKRLTKELNKKGKSNNRLSSDVFAQKIHVLENEKKKLEGNLKKTRAENYRLQQAVNGQVPEHKNSRSLQIQVDKLIKENENLARLLQITEKRGDRNKKEQGRVIANLRTENQELLNKTHNITAASRFDNDEKQRQSAKIKSLEKTVSNLKGENQQLSLLLKESDTNKVPAQDTQLEEQLNHLQNENQKLVLLLRQPDTKNNDENTKLKQQIEQLEIVNKTLVEEKRNLLSQDKTQISKKTTQITALQNDLSKLRQENAQMVLSLKQANESNQATQNSQELAKLQQDVNALELENKNLLKQVSEQKSLVAQSQEVSQKSDKGIEELQKQNASLRQTIAAQNDVLKRTDNAAQKAESLITENLALKRQLEQSNKTSGASDENVKNLVAHNQNITEQLKKQNEQLAKMEGLKQTVKQLRIENDRYALRNQKSDDIDKHITKLEEEKKVLERNIEKERQASSAYRKKIGEYQTQITQGGSKQKEDRINALRLENQELKARLDLLVSQQSKSAVNYVQGQNATPQKNVKIIETSYPKVDKVSPILNEQGERIHKHQGNASAEKPDAEDLLQQKLKPLSQNSKSGLN